MKTIECKQHVVTRSAESGSFSHTNENVSQAGLMTVKASYSIANKFIVAFFAFIATASTFVTGFEYLLQYPIVFLFISVIYFICRNYTNSSITCFFIQKTIKWLTLLYIAFMSAFVSTIAVSNLVTFEKGDVLIEGSLLILTIVYFLIFGVSFSSKPQEAHKHA